MTIVTPEATITISPRNGYAFYSVETRNGNQDKGILFNLDEAIEELVEAYCDGN